MMRTMVSVFLIAAMLSGCTMSRKERYINAYEGVGDAPLKEAPFKGRYTLYRTPRTGPETPVTSVALEPPAQVGFRSVNDLHVAIAGERSIDLEQGRYTWKATPDAGQHDAQRTKDTAATTGLIILGIIGLIAVSALAL